MKKILVLNGPNINMLGIREKNVYGTATYEDLCEMIRAKAAELKLEVEIRQSNSEGQLVDWIQECYGRMDGIIMNPGAYTHYSVAVLDALKAVCSRGSYQQYPPAGGFPPSLCDDSGLYRPDLRPGSEGILVGTGIFCVILFP